MSRTKLSNDLALKRAQRELEQYYQEITIHENKISILREKIDRLFGMNYGEKNVATEDIMLEARLKRIEDILVNFDKKLNIRQQIPVDKKVTEHDMIEDHDTLARVLREQIESRQSRGDSDHSDDETVSDNQSAKLHASLNNNKLTNDKRSTKQQIKAKIEQLRNGNPYSSESSEDSAVIYHGNDQIYDI